MVMIGKVESKKIKEKQIKQLIQKALKALDSGFKTPMPNDLYQHTVERIRERCSALERSLTN